MIVQNVPAYWWQIARRCAEELVRNGSKPHFTSERDQLADQIQRRARGFIGELAFLHAFPEAKWASEFGSDININGHSVEIKTKYWRKDVDPQDLVQVADAQSRQKPHQYVFTRLISDTRVILLGRFPAKEFWEKSIALKKGELDPFNPTWKAPCDCHALRICDLIPLNGQGC